MNLMVADGQSLPMANGSVSEVYLSNVVGSQMGDTDLEKLLKEARRVIGAAGRLTIRENNTPHWVSPDLNDIVRAAGFVAGLAYYQYGSCEYDELVQQYGVAWSDTDESYEMEEMKREYYFAISEVGQ
jgi:hypothetical protein